jgi:phosphomannomutase
MPSVNIPSSIFKAYDIRGLVETELSPELAYRIGRAFVVWLRQNSIILEDRYLVVGRDMRPSSEPFQREVMRGITDEGIDVVDIGLASTPLFNFAVAHYLKHAGGIMITASHNPAEYNGFKITLENGLPLGKNNGMDELRDLVLGSTPPNPLLTVEEGEVISPPPQQEGVGGRSKGKIVQKDIFPDYLQKIFTIIRPETIKPCKIIVDAGNGMAQVTLPKVLAQLPVEVEYLYLEPDGTFPNHEANPLKTETLQDLQKKVVETGAAFGFALDGDCDRVGLVEEKGEVVDASFVGTLIGREVLRSHPHALMLYDLRSSMIVKEVWEENGATTAMCKVGHANIKPLLLENEAAFASELSLHLYYHDFYNVECSDLSLLYILQALSREQEPLSALIQPFKKYVHSGEINFEIQNKDEVMKRIEETYGESALEISHLDGLWMKFNWGWVSVRSSNTEPVMRLNLEAKSEEVMKEKIEEFKVLIIDK